MSDRIHISGLRLRAVIGVDDAERAAPRELQVDLELETDLHGPGESDALEDALDYRALTKAVVEHVESSSFFLLERLAESIVGLILRGHRAVRAVTVRVHKPGAVRFADSVAVQIRRERTL